MEVKARAAPLPLSQCLFPARFLHSSDSQRGVVCFLFERFCQSLLSYRGKGASIGSFPLITHLTKKQCKEALLASLTPRNAFKGAALTILAAGRVFLFKTQKFFSRASLKQPTCSRGEDPHLNKVSTACALYMQPGDWLDRGQVVCALSDQPQPFSSARMLSEEPAKESLFALFWNWIKLQREKQEKQELEEWISIVDTLRYQRDEVVRPVSWAVIIRQ